MKQASSHIKFILLLSFMTFAAGSAFSQGVVVNKYTFGEGYDFTTYDDDDYSIAISGFVQPSYERKFYTDHEFDGPAQRFRMRRIRLRYTGTAARQRIIWRLQGEFSGNLEGDASIANYLTDAWVGYRLSRRWKLRVGQKNTPTDNRQLLIRSHSLQLVERSRITGAFSTIREFGAFLDGTVPLGRGMYIKPSAVITNGDGVNAFNADLGGFKYGGRLDFLPFGLFTNLGQYHEMDMMREQVPRLVFGVTYSYNEGVSSRRGRESGSIRYLNDANELSLPDFEKIGVDFLFKYRGFSALGEFVTTRAYVPTDITQRIRNDGSITGTFPVGDTDDMVNYVKGRMMLGTGVQLQMGYLFKNRFSVDARFTNLAAAEHSFLNNGTFYNRPNYYTFGLAQHFGKFYGAKVQASITYVEVNPGSNDINGLGNPMTGNELIFRLITSIAF
ncbi:MAG: porin [Cryomorphaceae bacterium]|nr:porin [Flavobacteriales bacterium]